MSIKSCFRIILGIMLNEDFDNNYNDTTTHNNENNHNDQNNNNDDYIEPCTPLGKRRNALS